VQFTKSDPLDVSAIQFNTVVELLNSTGLPLEIDWPNKQVRASVQATNGDYVILLAVNSTGELIEAACFIQDTIEPWQYAVVAELCVRANYKLNRGRLDFCFESGTLRSQSSEFIEGVGMQVAMPRALDTAVSVLDHHYLAIRRVLESETEPEMALERLS